MKNFEVDDGHINYNESGNFLPVGHVRATTRQVHRGRRIWLPENIYNFILNISRSPPKFVGAVMCAVFGEETLIKSTITGKISNRSHKKENQDEKKFEMLDSTKLQACQDFYKYWLNNIYSKWALMEEKRKIVDEKEEEEEVKESDDSQKLSNNKKQKTKLKKKRSKVFDLNYELKQFNEYARRRISYLKREETGGKRLVVNKDENLSSSVTMQASADNTSDVINENECILNDGESSNENQVIAEESSDEDNLSDNDNRDHSSDMEVD